MGYLLLFYLNDNYKESFSALIQSTPSPLETIGAKGCVVLGDANFYSKFGFNAIPAFILEHVLAEYFQVLVFGQKVL
ncbi:hypothetical protein [Acinetobacter sp. SFB]|uniref:hypothetical protein n=1 Tax=Acinetobacter sp. SFB TaxID=1805634 RepID=UPI0012DEB0C6|nr:hypothetical protein [Acinetobacter sp. SFB]